MMTHRSITLARGLLAATLMSFALSGCASSKPASAAGASKPNAPAEAARRHFAGAADGLEVHRWNVQEQGDRIPRALARHASGAPLDFDAQARLKRNGWRFVRVPADQLDSLANDLGGTTFDSNEWHGQVPEWRALAAQPVTNAGRAVAIDGMVRRYEQGEFRLMMRSWTVQMEDGPYVHLEMLPQRHFPPTNDLRRLLGEDSSNDQGFASMALDLQLQSGFAYVLVAESPQADWPGVDDLALPAPDGKTSSANTPAPSPPRKTARVGPSDLIGPDAAPPPTLGELLLAGDGAAARGRTMLVFVPRISSNLFVPQAASAQGTAAGSANPHGAGS